MLADALSSLSAVQTTMANQEKDGTPDTDAHGASQHVAPGPSGGKRSPGMGLLIGLFFFCTFFWGFFI